MNTFDDRENKVLSFMEQVQEAKVIQEQEDAFRQSTDYKLKTLDKCEKDAREICLDSIFARVYKDAIPLNDDYKQAYMDDLDASFKDFMAVRCPKGIEYYVKEGLRKNSPFAKRVLEAVNNLVDEEMRDKALNIEDIDPKDLVFNNSEDVQKRLNVIGQDLAVPEISQAIKDNVRQTALSEITRAKAQKEELKNLESELANDVNINTEEAVKEALELKGYGQLQDYVPSLFESVLINKLNKLQPTYESGELQQVYLYGAVADYGKDEVTSESGDVSFATLEELAFVEAVKEYTGLSMLKALKLESFTKSQVEDLAQTYAQERF
jgi:hypothetical protein